MKTNINLTLYRSDTAGNAQNCVYRHEIRATNADELRPALRYDHVFVKFRDNRRSNGNFEYADYLVLDCDNDHSENRSDWIWPEDLAAMLPDVPFVTYTSRHHNMAKKNKSPRPRFHVIFPIERTHDAESYAAMKRKAAESLPFFDDNALDAGRFFFAVANPEILFHPGERLLPDWLSEYEQGTDGNTAQDIPEGKRNAVLCRFAASILKRLGDTDAAYKAFLEKAEHCVPPLPEREVSSIWHGALKFYRATICRQPGYVPPESYPAFAGPLWEEPVPLAGPVLPDFPTEVLPSCIAGFVSSVAESLQIPQDMAAVFALGILSLCLQRKFAVRLNADWLEPVNLYVKIVADPSERKSPCEKQMMAPVQAYENDWNRDHALEIATGWKMKAALADKVENTQKMLARDRATVEELQKAVREEQEFRPLSMLRLFLGDVTPEKLISQLAENGGVCAIVVTEGGVLDNFAGRYNGSTNVDVLLNGFSGDTIRKDRVGGASETVENPALTIIIMEQPRAFSDFMNNKDFRGRGLTARFLYCFPKSLVGERSSEAKTVPEEIRSRYGKLIRILLSTSMESTREIRLTEKAEEFRRAFADEIELRLNGEYADMKDWAGKIVGTSMRIAGLICLAELAEQLIDREKSLDCVADPLITEEQMQRAVVIGSYFIEQAKAAHARTGSVQIIELCKRVLEAVQKNQLEELSTRILMKACSFLVTAEEAQKVLDHLEVLGYISIKNAEERHGRGRPASPLYLVNPLVLQNKK